jgi:hypothetical protein
VAGAGDLELSERRLSGLLLWLSSMQVLAPITHFLYSGAVQGIVVLELDTYVLVSAIRISSNNVRTEVFVTTSHGSLTLPSVISLRYDNIH